MSDSRSRPPRTGHGSDGLSVVGQHPWRARLRARNEEIVGAGVLVDQWHVLTCAHVVSAALEVESSEPPGEEVTVELPFMPASRDGSPDSQPVRLRARVSTRGWAPASAGGGGDLTLLRLEQAAPRDCAVARLARAVDTSGKGVLVYGHPDGLDDGVWTRTSIGGVGGPRGEWLQLDAAHFAGRSVTRGFSGAGAVDEGSGHILGIVVAHDGADSARVAWAIRMEVAVTYLPLLADLLSGEVESVGAQAREGLRRETLRTDGQRETRPGHGGAGVAGTSVAVDRLNEAEWDHLSMLLRAVPGMVAQQWRELHLRQLPERFGIRLTRPRRWPTRSEAGGRLDVEELLEALADSPEAARQLVAMLRSDRLQTPQLAALEEFVERTFPDLLLEAAERARLQELLDGIAPVYVGAALSSATAQLAIPPPTGPRSVAEAIRDLEGFGRSGPEWPPLLIFVDDLAHDIGGPVSAALHHWIAAVAARWDLPQAQVTALCAAGPQRRAALSALSLLILLEPDRSDPERYLMSARLMHHDRTERVLHCDDVPRTLTEIAHELDGVLRSVPESLGDQASEPIIEFVLPRRLLDEAVEEWELGKTSFPIRLGLRYQVVVRSLDRMRDPIHHPTWRRKWRRLTEMGRRADAEALHVLVPQCPDATVARGLFASLTSRDSVVCLAVPHPPDTSLPVEADVFAAGIAAGVPAVLWAREPVDRDTFRELACDQLAGDHPAGMPSRVRTHRQRVASGQVPPEGITSGIGLLFDDADRVPRQFRHPIRLQAPR